MGRLTINLDDEIHLALKEAAVRQGRSIGKIIEESLLFRGIKSTKYARSLVERARSESPCSPEDALALAIEETRSFRAS